MIRPAVAEACAIITAIALVVLVRWGVAVVDDLRAIAAAHPRAVQSAAVCASQLETTVARLHDANRLVRRVADGSCVCGGPPSTEPLTVPRSQVDRLRASDAAGAGHHIRQTVAP